MSMQDLAYSSIHRWIDEGELTRGEITSENQLCSRLQISRTPVRSALQRLEWEGLVKIVPKHGVMVLDVSAKQAGEWISVLEAILLYAVETIGNQNQPAIANIVVKYKDSFQLDTENPKLTADKECKLLEEIISATGNTQLLQVFNSTLIRLGWKHSIKRWEVSHRMETLQSLDTLILSLSDVRIHKFQVIRSYFIQWRNTL